MGQLSGSLVPALQCVAKHRDTARLRARTGRLGRSAGRHGQAARCAGTGPRPNPNPNPVGRRRRPAGCHAPHRASSEDVPPLRQGPVGVLRHRTRRRREGTRSTRCWEARSRSRVVADWSRQLQEAAGRGGSQCVAWRHIHEMCHSTTKCVAQPCKFGHCAAHWERPGTEIPAVGSRSALTSP